MDEENNTLSTLGRRHFLTPLITIGTVADERNLGSVASVIVHDNRTVPFRLMTPNLFCLYSTVIRNKMCEIREAVMIVCQ